MADSTEVLCRTILEEASIGRFQLALKALEAGLVTESLTDQRGCSLLHLAVWASDVHTVRELLQRCPTLLNRATPAGITALMLAATKGDLTIIHTLLSAGADVSPRDERGADCVLVAAENDRALAILCLHWGGCDFSTTDSAGCGVVHYAGYYDSRNTMELCVSLSLDLQMKDKKGMTPLHRAAISNASRSAERLLAAGADCSIPDNAGKAPIQVACENGSLGIMAAMQRRQPWRLRPAFFYAYVFLTAANYWTFTLRDTAHFLGLSLLFINSLLVSLLLFLFLPSGEVVKMQGTDIDSLRTAFQSGDLSPFCHESDFCFTCMRKRPARTHHCRVCGHCVPEFDQHSQLFGACVGRTARLRFVLALTSLLAALAANVYLEYLAGVWEDAAVTICYWQGNRPLYSLAFSVVHVLALWCVWWEWLLEFRALSSNLTVYESLHRHQCRYLFEAGASPSGAPLLLYRNPNDNGRIRNYLSFLFHN